jgi:hypothetical protein
MKTILNLLILLSFNATYAQYQGPVNEILSGYGANGNFSVSHIDIPNNHNTFLKPISIFYPQGTTSPVPTIFYSHGYASSDTAFHIETLHHIASKGYAVVFVPYKTLGVSISQRYLTLFDGFTKAARTNTSIIDTTRVGFYGQSFGGGATPRIAYRAFTENNWGANGKFIFCSAPWYSFELNTSNLPNFPNDCNMLTVLYDDDLTNDHRLGMDIFNNIAIHDSIKDCLIVYSDTIGGYIYEADHTLPPQYTNSGEFDALDFYVTFRLIDALADYSFNGNQTAKNVALGNGSLAQLNMGGQLKNLTHSNTPSPIYPESIYTNPCSDIQNVRSSFCGTIASSEELINKTNQLKIYPNPTQGKISFIPSLNYKNIKISIYSSQGLKMMEVKNQTNIDLTDLNNGVYFTTIVLDDSTFNSKIIISK